MTDNGNALAPLLAELHAEYGGFECTAGSAGETVITGPYALDAAYGGVRLAEDFELQLTIPESYPRALPKVKELTNVISPNYEHLFTDRSFCLGVQGELLIAQLRDPSLVRLIDGPVRSYLYTYLFQDRYGRYPFGDRAHGAKGILQFYSELFKEPDPLKAIRLLQETCAGKYRGHLPCPCGSGIPARKCHGETILALKSSAAIAGAKIDLAQICLEFKAAENESEKRRSVFEKTGIQLNASEPVDAFFERLRE